MKQTLTLFLVLVGIWQMQAQPSADKNVPMLIRFDQAQMAFQKPNVFQQLFGMRAEDELKSVSVTTDNLNFVHERHQQYYKGVPVEGAYVTLHNEGPVMHSLSGEYMDIPELDVQPRVNERAAYQQALRHAKVQRLMNPGTPAVGELVVVVSPLDGYVPHLTYKFDIYSEEPLYRAYVYVDAHSGVVSMENPLLHQENAPASGSSLYNGTVSFTADRTGGSSYRLRQTANGRGVETYSLNNGTNYNSARDVSSSSNFFNSDATAVQAHYGAEQTHDYFLQKHGRNSYDGNGTKLLSYVHYSRNYVNAFWDGSRMTYGDGDGRNYGPLVSLDITGHEIAHGVTQFSANLVYQRESGALNESFSDIFGEMIEYYATGNNDWQMGTDIGIGRSGAIRSMDNPNAFNDPDTYGGSLWQNPDCFFPSQSNDYCGVHINSGVQNKWFYILTVGESGTNDLGNAYAVSGIGREKAAAIAYRNLTVYLSTNSTFANARAGAIQSAIDLYGSGSPEEVATTNAWYAVGVGEAYQGTPNPDPDPDPEPDTEAPTQVQDLVASNTEANSTLLSWAAANDNVGVTSYKVYVDQAERASTEELNYALTGLEEATSYDIYVTALDEAGNESIPSETVTVTTLEEGSGTGEGEEVGPDTLFAHFFETGWDGWADGGSDSYRYGGFYSFEGFYSIRLRDNSGTASSMTSPAYDVTDYTQLDIEFYFYAVSMEGGEDFFVEFFNGSSWQTVASFASGISFRNNVFYVVNLTVNNVDYNFPSNARFRIRCDASTNYDQIYVDGVSLIGSSSNVLLTTQAGNNLRIGELAEGIPAVTLGKGNSYRMYPNPAVETITVESDSPIRSVQVYAPDGRPVKAPVLSAGEQVQQMDISHLATGVYFLTIESETNTVYQKLIKQ